MYVIERFLSNLTEDCAEPGQLASTMSDFGLGQFQDVLRQALAAGAVGVDPFTWTPPPARRRPRRLDVVTYVVRIDLKGTRPPLWRRLELASDLFLHDLHDVIQAAFGWTDSHLHRFGSGPEYYSRDTEYYLCPFDVEEGEISENCRIDMLRTVGLSE